MNMAELRAREAIRHTLAAYNMAGDARDPLDFANCFTEDGIFRSAIFDLVGREAIRNWFGERVSGSSAIRLVRHQLSTCHISFQDEGEAKVRTYFMVISDHGLDHGGIYIDRFRCVDASWLIAQRDIQTDWARADSLLVPPQSRQGITILSNPDIQ